MIQIYNSMSQRLEMLMPREPGRVGIYVCGMTVYDLCHIGHARALIVFDMVVRYLRDRGYDVTYVRNITDIDDKIINRAREIGEPVAALSGRFIQAMHEDAAFLGLLQPDREPRATQFVEEIVAMLGRLMDRGFAYQGDNGDIYFSVRKFPDYGALSGQSIDKLRSGARVAPDESKRDPLDFVLWKSAKPGEPQWNSPWGAGRPGWHIECSAMSTVCLGDGFDIHGGGVDLKFPHHECEIAQSEAATGVQFAKLWMHNGHVRIDEEKMSKSLGNFFTIREVLDRDGNRQRMGEVIRYMVLSSHYRSPLNYSPGALATARAALTRMYLVLDKLSGAGTSGARSDSLGEYQARFQEAMDNDFNTPEALAVLFELVRDANRAVDGGDRVRASALGGELRRLAQVLGLLGSSPAAFLREPAADKKSAGLDDATVERLIGERARARLERNFARADEIRATLDAGEIIIEDQPDGGARWRRR